MVINEVTELDSPEGRKTPLLQKESLYEIEMAEPIRLH